MASKFPMFVADAEYETINTDNTIISVDTYTTYLDTTGGGLTGLKLGNGVEKGQVKKIMMKTGNDIAITEPLTNLYNGTNIYIQSGVGNYVILEWIGTDWVVVDNYGSVISITSMNPQVLFNTPGAIIDNITNVTNLILNDGINGNFSLGTGYITGQLKLIRYISDTTSSAIITSNFYDDGVITITLNRKNQQVVLLWTSGNKWKIITNIGATIA